MLPAEILKRLTDGVHSSWHVTPTPWTTHDIQIYYKACQPDTDMMDLLSLRCQLHDKGYLITPYDGLQRQRDMVRVPEDYNTLMLFEQLRQQVSVDEFEALLFNLLSIYKTQLTLATPDHDMCDVLLKVDMINQHFAFKFMQAIENKPSDFTPLKATLEKLGALTSEVLPWLSVRLRADLFDDELDDVHTNGLVYSAMRFYCTMSSGVHAHDSIKSFVGEALRGNRVLPVSAGLFYDKLEQDREGVIALIRRYADKAPDTLTAVMNLVFSDKAYLTQHLQLLEDRVHPALTTEQYPLFMFRKHHQPYETAHSNAAVRTTFEIVRAEGDDAKSMKGMTPAHK